MARYYFDIYDGKHLIQDKIGIDCINSDMIRAEAMTILPATARNIVPKEGDRQALMILVRNTNNLTVFRATLTFSSIWLGENMPPLAEDADQAEHMYLI